MPQSNTTLKGPVQTERSAVIKDSRIGPHVYLGANTEVIDSEISNAVVMDHCVIRRSIVSDSVIGPNSVVEGGIIEMICGPDTRIMAGRRGESRSRAQVFVLSAPCSPD